MTPIVEFKNFEPRQAIRDLIGRRASHLDELTRHLSPVFLRIEIDEVPVRTLYRIHLTVDVPQKTIVAKQETHDLASGIRAAFAEIERQIKSHKASLRGEQWWKRVARRKKLQEIKAGETKDKEAALSSDFISGVNPYVEKLRTFARSIVASAESSGDLPQGEVDPEDLVTETFLRANEEFEGRRPKGSIQNWLMRLASRQLEAEVNRFRKEHNQAIDLEGDAPETYRPEGG